MPSAITRSPGFRPSAISQSEPIRSPDIDLVVRTEHGQQVFALHLGDRALRHKERVLDDRHGRPDPAELARPQEVVGVREQRGDLEGASGHVRLAVEDGDLACLRIDRSVDQDQLERQVLWFLAGGDRGIGQLEVFTFADVEVDLYRVHCRHGGQFRLAVGAEQVADLRLGDAGDAGNRRCDLGKAEVELGRLQVCVRGLQFGLCRLEGAGCVVEVFLADCVLGSKRLDPGQVGGSGVEACDLLGADAGCLVGCRLEGPGVDLEQRLAFLNEVTFAVVLPDQVAGHLGADDGIDVAIQCPDPFHMDRYVPLDGLDHLDYRRRWRWRLLLFAAGRGEKRQTGSAKGNATQVADSGEGWRRYGTHGSSG